MQTIPLNIELLLRILLAALCGIAVGLERGFRQKEAGQRTHCVIAVGACAFMILSVYGFSDFTGDMDVTQIACQIVCGVGFLGVGIIYKDDSTGISGLSTATGLWATAAIGMTCGVGMYGLALCVTALLVLFQLLLNVTHLDTFGYTVQQITLEATDFVGLQEHLKQAKRKYRMEILSFEYARNNLQNTAIVRFRFKMKGTLPLKEVLRFLKQHDEIKDISM